MDLWNWVWGIKKPKTRPKTPPKTLTDVSWRPYVSWDSGFEQGLLTNVKTLKPQEKPNLLMIGPVGSGKSSFINAVISVGKGRKYAMALTGDVGDKSCTTDFVGYTHAELLQDYNLMDSMGLEPKYKTGFHPDDIALLLKGHIKKGYTFNPVKAISTENGHFRKDPVLADQCHCVIFVVSATTMYDGIGTVYIDKIKALNAKIREEHVPRVLILTKVDQLCDDVKKDIKNLFKSIKVEKAVKFASEFFGIELASIHPVKNYEVDYNVETETNIPILLALRQVMEYASDRVDFVLDRNVKTD